MTTAIDIIRSSLEKLGVYAPGETITDADATRGLIALNDMLSQWSDEYLNIYTLTALPIVLTATKGAYTIGATGTPDIVAVRPVRIQAGPGAASLTVPDVEVVSGAINNPGSGGTPGVVVLTGTSGTGTKFQALGTISVTGVLTGDIQITLPGNYTVSPTTVGEAVTGGGLSGATLDIALGDIASAVNVVSQIEWASIESINSGTGRPDTLYYNPTYPNGILNLAPVPNAVGTVVFQACYPFLGFSDLFTPDVVFCDGAEETIKDNLAVTLKPYFSSAALDPVVAGGALRTKEMFRYTNLTSRAMIGRGRQQAAGAAR